MTRDEVIEMINRAADVRVGVKGVKYTCYFPVTHEYARNLADEIAGFGLLVEFGRLPVLSKTLYIEGA